MMSSRSYGNNFLLQNMDISRQSYYKNAGGYSNQMHPQNYLSNEVAALSARKVASVRHLRRIFSFAEDCFAFQRIIYIL